MIQAAIFQVRCWSRKNTCWRCRKCICAIEKPSSGVLLLRIWKYRIQKQVLPTFFPTSTTGEAQGDVDGQIYVLVFGRLVYGWGFNQ